MDEIARRLFVKGAVLGALAFSVSGVEVFGQTHELPNLYVSGCGIFPTISSANPTFTLNALALRGAEQLVAQWGTIAS
jgi:choline dehydrogenase-like flavoprotein